VCGKAPLETNVLSPKHPRGKQVGVPIRIEVEITRDQSGSLVDQILKDLAVLSKSTRVILGGQSVIGMHRNDI